MCSSSNQSPLEIRMYVFQMEDSFSLQGNKLCDYLKQAWNLSRLNDTNMNGKSDFGRKNYRKM